MTPPTPPAVPPAVWVVHEPNRADDASVWFTEYDARSFADRCRVDDPDVHVTRYVLPDAAPPAPPAGLLTARDRHLMVCAMQEATDGALSDATCERIISDNAARWLEAARWLLADDARIRGTP
jgi:hypothetical protein